ncbi:hypothetical protein [Haloterrigena salinisoli]|uniref:hypothetical protein n=1 Tax=Haloterrigena salinisoli TaxID=3132747 RepID=UPI0030D0869A
MSKPLEIKDYPLPIHIKWNSQDRPVRILFIDGLFDIIKPIYDIIKPVSEVMTVKEQPEAVENVIELIRGLTVEYGAFGWVFAICVLELVLLAAEKLVSIGKFTYEKTGFGMNFGQYFGASGYVLLEYPVVE